MDDVPDHLKPTSIITEIVEQMENLKEYMTPYKERDDELLNSIKQIKRGAFADKIYTCSYTLDALVGQLKASLDNEDTLKQKINSQSKSIYHLKQQLADQKSKN